MADRPIGNFPGIPILEADQTQLVDIKIVRASNRIKDMRRGIRWTAPVSYYGEPW